eukprot:scaffold14.g1120.t1
MATSAALGRRELLSAAAAAMLALAQRQAQAAQVAPVPAPPPVGDCFECIGEVNNTLNACPLAADSCISTFNDDAHFAAPWQYDGERDAAIAQLVSIASGGDYSAGLIDSFAGISKGDAAAYIAKGVLAVATGEAEGLPAAFYSCCLVISMHFPCSGRGAGGQLPEQPKRQLKSGKPFDGKVLERHTTSDGAEYLWIVLGTAGGAAAEVEDPSLVIDAEFLFLPNDDIVNGIMLDKNVARRHLEALREALRWEVAPVITDFDPAFNIEAPTLIDKLLDPFDRRNGGRAVVEHPWLCVLMRCPACLVTL